MINTFSIDNKYVYLNETKIKQFCVYVSSPMSIGNIGENISRGIKCGEELRQLGYTVFIPHLSFWWNEKYLHSWEEWIVMDFSWLLKCDCMLVLEGESRGVDIEIQFCGQHNIPVCYSIEEVDKLYSQWE